MRQPILAASAIALSTILAACSGKPPAMPNHAFVQQGVTMKLDPASAPDCKPTTTYRAMLSWTVGAGNASKTEVRLGQPNGDVFARSDDQRAHAETGNWVKPGMWFLLFDRRTNEMLGALQVGPKNCP